MGYKGRTPVSTELRPQSGRQTRNTFLNIFLGYISIYAYQVPSESDNRLTWPVYGKQITMGIVEQGKPIEERVTMRRSIVTEPGNGAEDVARFQK